MVLGLPPNISIDKRYLNGTSRLGPNCKHSLCRHEVFHSLAGDLACFPFPDLLGTGALCCLSLYLCNERCFSRLFLVVVPSGWRE